MAPLGNRRSNPLTSFEDHDLLAAFHEMGGGSQPLRTGTDNNNGQRLIHHELLTLH
ncbi:hypothetical protein [Microbacterium phyllosphaerae]|uniref:hypothetical protein n=1 Tax=Microbacterium phyllosphaerae TaxID=124798 RepID=UPI003D767F2E